MSVGLTALAGTGRGDETRAGEHVPSAPSTGAPTRPAPPAVLREIGRLQVDLAVAQATFDGVTRGATATVDDADLRGLERTIADVEAWLARHDPYPASADDDQVLQEAAAHRQALGFLVARVREATATPTATAGPTTTPTPRATQRATTTRPAPSRRQPAARPTAAATATPVPTPQATADPADPTVPPPAAPTPAEPSAPADPPDQPPADPTPDPGPPPADAAPED